MNRKRGSIRSDHRTRLAGADHKRIDRNSRSPSRGAAFSTSRIYKFEERTRFRLLAISAWKVACRSASPRGPNPASQLVDQRSAIRSSRHTCGSVTGRSDGFSTMNVMKNGVCKMRRVNQQHASDDRNQWKTVIHSRPLSMGRTSEAAEMLRVPSIKIDHKNAKVSVSS